MGKTPCLNCQHIETSRDPGSMVFRCGLGFFDKAFGEMKTKTYYAASGLVHGNVAICKASKACESHKVMGAELAK